MKEFFQSNIKAGRKPRCSRNVCEERDKRAEMCAQLTNMARISTFYNINGEGDRIYVSEAGNEKIREQFTVKV